jgi:two-component system, LytTR family, sensor kinase
MMGESVRVGGAQIELSEGIGETAQAALPKRTCRRYADQACLWRMFESNYRHMSRSSANRGVTNKLALLAMALVLWGSLVLLFAAPLALTNRVSWRQAVNFGGSFWALWLLFLPVVTWLAFRFPIERKKLLRNVGLHLLACLLIVGTNRATFRALSRAFPPVALSPPLSERPGRAPEPRAPAPGPPNALGVFFGLRAALDVLVYGALMGVCQAVTNFRSSQERERRAAELEARLTRAQLQALRMQINPHFLFNTLNSIAALVYVNPRAADEMLGDLSELLRRSLELMEEQELPLGQELELIGAYLSIEQKRFGERLRLEQNVPADLLKALVPALILQPVVENAIRHGIEPRRGPGLISIEAKQENNHLHLSVRDDGRGLSSLDVNGSGRRGIGLANTKARLQGLYGQNQSFSFGKAEPRGCRVDIRLPLHLEPGPVPAVSDEPAA